MASSDSIKNESGVAEPYDRSQTEMDGDSVFQPKLTKAYTKAITRGRTRLEKKSSWAFDYYQASGFFPVDYHYWWTPYMTSFGPTQLTMIHAVAYADGTVFSADQMQHRRAMKESHKLAIREIR